MEKDKEIDDGIRSISATVRSTSKMRAKKKRDEDEQILLENIKKYGEEHGIPRETMQKVMDKAREVDES